MSSWLLRAAFCPAVHTAHTQSFTLSSSSPASTHAVLHSLQQLSSLYTTAMSSGVAVDPGVDELVHQMLTPGSCKSKHHDRLKLVVLCLNDEKDQIIVDKPCTRYVRDLEGCDTWKEIMAMFVEKKCCYAVYDCFYHTKENSEKEELVLISWCPDDASVKDKMTYSASWKALQRKFPAIKHHWQMCDASDKDCDNLCDKFGPKGTVKFLEGKCLGPHKHEEKH